MFDELQMAVKETTSPVTTNSVRIVEPTGPISMQGDSALDGENYNSQENFFYGERTCKLFNELFAALKDDRMNTKKAISADIESTARVQNQNERVIYACERELRRHDLTGNQRLEILNIMSKAAEASNDVSEESREFHKEQLKHSHNFPLWLLTGAAGVAFLWFGGKVLLRST